MEEPTTTATTSNTGSNKRLPEEATQLEATSTAAAGTGHQREGHRQATRCGLLTSPPIRVVEGVIIGRLPRARQTGFTGREVQAALLTRELSSMSNSVSRLGVGATPRQHLLATELQLTFNEHFKVPSTHALLADYVLLFMRSQNEENCCLFSS